MRRLAGRPDGDGLMKPAETLPEVLELCAAGVVAANVDIDIAIAAHQQAPSPCTLRVVVLAREPTLADTQRQLDYLSALPDAAWEGMPDAKRCQEATLAAIRRGIAWRSL